MVVSPYHSGGSQPAPTGSASDTPEYRSGVRASIAAGLAGTILGCAAAATSLRATKNPEPRREESRPRFSSRSYDSTTVKVETPLHFANCLTDGIFVPIRNSRSFTIRVIAATI